MTDGARAPGRGHFQDLTRLGPRVRVRGVGSREHEGQAHHLEEIVAAARVRRVGAQRQRDGVLEHRRQREAPAAEHQVARRIVDDRDAVTGEDLAFVRCEPDAVGDREPLAQKTRTRHLLHGSARPRRAPAHRLDPRFHEVRVGVEPEIMGQTAPHGEQRRRAALERVRAQQDRDARVSAPAALQVAVHALGGSGAGTRRGVEHGADLRRQRDLQELVIEDIVDERRERDTHAARLVGAQRRLGPSRVREVIEAGRDPVADHLGGAEHHGQADRLGAKRSAVRHGVEGPGLERQPVLRPLQ